MGGFLHDLYSARGKVLPARTSPIVIGDKSAYFSPIDRTVVEGRTAHREHMERHNVYEAGDVKLGEMSGTEKSPMASPRADIQRAIQELSSR